jgi:hypothetical protein
MKILIVGDSFAADWTVKYPTQSGWPNLLAQKYDVTNIAQAGVSEYKILKQLQSVNITEYNLVIASHTSPLRVHTNTHPIHQSDDLHTNADLILSDLLYHLHTFTGFFNWALRAAIGYFKYHYDDNFQIDVYKLIRQDIKSMITVPYLVLSNHIVNDNLIIESNVLKIGTVQLKHPGLINHMSDTGNRIVFDTIDKFIKNNIK